MPKQLIESIANDFQNNINWFPEVHDPCSVLATGLLMPPCTLCVVFRQENCLVKSLFLHLLVYK